MGTERGTVVPSSNIELPAIADLADPRLSRAFKSWSNFSLSHKPQISSIGKLQPQEFASLAIELSKTIIDTIGSAKKIDSTLDIKKIAHIKEVIEGQGSKVIFMRHGEQSPPEWIFSVPNPALRKIRMMQDPFNKQDLLTNDSLVNVFVTAFTLLYLQETTGKKIQVLSSENFRAKEVGEVIAKITHGSALVSVDGLNCVRYRDEEGEPAISEEQILKELPLGMLPWDPELVDRICKKTKAGRKQSEAIAATVTELIKQGDNREDSTIFLVITHTQQIAEVLRQVGSLTDPTVRFPELTMVVMKDKKPIIFEKGILSQRIASPVAIRDMRKVLEVMGDGYEWYKIRRAEYDQGQKIPFLVSPEPLKLSSKDAQEILRIGNDVVDFVEATDELYRSDETVKKIMDRGKPRLFHENRLSHYLFARPDLIKTQEGFTVCEIETSPFGLALAELLNRSYRFVGFDTLVADNTLSDFIAASTPVNGNIVYSQKTASYAGQLSFLAEKVFSGKGRQWKVGQIDDVTANLQSAVYRGFYLHEYTTDLFVHNAIESLSKDSKTAIIPSLTPHMEDKVLLALIWDKRWASFLSKQLGNASFKHLREVIPLTWIIGQEQFFVPGLPGGLETSSSLADLPRSKRQFVLKKSGFGEGSSWSEGVNFLQEKSSIKATELLNKAIADESSSYIIQEFRKCQECRMPYIEEDRTLSEMNARIRLTPYFSLRPKNRGQLLAIKVTGCEDTNYVHATTSSINTAVA